MAKPAMRRVVWVLGACVLSGVLLRLSYPVPGLFPLAWVALVPWFVVLREGEGRGWVLGSAAMGLVAAGLGLSWQYIVTVPGGMGLTLYVGSYFLLFAWLVRVAARRLRVPFVVAAPTVWVGCEFLRSFLITGFPWLFVGHTQHPFTALVQVADLFGAYAVSFVVVAANAFAADAVAAWRRREVAWPRLAAGGAFVALLVGATVGYGAWRLAHLGHREGPLVGVVQGNVPQEFKNELTLEHIATIVADHMRLTRELQRQVGGQRLELVVWPETMVQLPLNRADYLVVRQFREEFVKLAQSLRCPILVGAYSEFANDRIIVAEADETVRTITDGEIATESRVYLLPHYTDPVTGDEPGRRILVREGQRVRTGDKLAEYQSVVYNSAYLFRPDRPFTRPDRYDKTHLVPFGEYVPLQELLWFLKDAVPFARGFTPGSRLNLIDLDGTRFGTLICFESVFPDIARGYVMPPDGQGADFLINISNDGWFCGSHELDQHLALCAFRAIEFRIGIVRSVNSGISAIIDTAGRIQNIVRDSRGRSKLVEGAAFGRVPLRQGLTFYARHGDIFAEACFALAATAFLFALSSAIVRRLRRRKCKGGACPV